MTEAEQEVAEFFRTRPTVKQAIDCLIKLLRAGQGTILDDDATRLSFTADIKHSNKSLSGKYRITIELLDEEV